MQIHTSRQAGGIASAAIRSHTSGSSMWPPSGSRYSNPRPHRRRVIPGVAQSDRRSRGIAALSSLSCVARGVSLGERRAFLDCDRAVLHRSLLTDRRQDHGAASVCVREIGTEEARMSGDEHGVGHR
jgi:hypothetical protein